jgi:NADH:ubiquinone oxidoreductase subunit F (NADH-binding)/(2Fe-2S) ferredoxin
MSALRVQVCAGSGCVAAGALRVAAALRRAVADDPGLEVAVREVDGSAEAGVRVTGCRGFCAMGPLVGIPEFGILYCRVGEEDALEIVERTLRRRELVERLLYRNPLNGDRCRGENEIPFFAGQTRRTLRRCGVIDPEDIDDYILHGGYAALQRVLTEMTPELVIDEIKRSGLQGRGGAGFPTGMKWELVAGADGTAKYVVCNGDEGEPGAFMDRSLMEGDPHAIVEGISIAAYAVGAQQAVLYTRAEYSTAVRRLRLAVDQARQRGLLGTGAIGTDSGLDLSVVEGAGAYVCGEETALLASIEGRRGMPSPRPPYPAYRGLWGCPTLINNVETLANVPSILSPDPESFDDVGTTLSKGTKTFALTGRVNNVGLVEVPLGTTLREIVFGIGGGIPGNGEFKAAHFGGPSGGALPAAHLDTPIDYESLRSLGAMMGSGGLVILDEQICMVRLARYFMRFCVEESCGKCPPCRIGNHVMLNLLDRIIAGRGQPGDTERLQTLGEHIQRTSLCGLGQTAPNPVLSGIRHFRGEFDAHVRDRNCPAGECSGLS